MTTQIDREMKGYPIKLTIWDILRALTCWRRRSPVGLVLSGDDGNTIAHPPR